MSFKKSSVDGKNFFSTLNKSLANTVEVGEENEYNLYLAKIKDLAKIKPYFEEVYEDLRHKSTDFQSQFVSAFRLHKNNFLGSEAVITKNLRTKETTLSYIVRNLSEVGSRKNNIVLQWFFNFTNMDQKISEVSEDFSSKPKEFYLNIRKINTDKQANAAILALREDLGDLGVNYK